MNNDDDNNDVINPGIFYKKIYQFFWKIVFQVTTLLTLFNLNSDSYFLCFWNLPLKSFFQRQVE